MLTVGVVFALLVLLVVLPEVVAGLLPPPPPQAVRPKARKANASASLGTTQALKLKAWLGLADDSAGVQKLHVCP